MISPMCKIYTSLSTKVSSILLVEHELTFQSLKQFVLQLQQLTQIEHVLFAIRPIPATFLLILRTLHCP